MSESEKAYRRIRSYADSLTWRMQLQESWRGRHPDFKTLEFKQDELDWESQGDEWTPSGEVHL